MLSLLHCKCTYVAIACALTLLACGHEPTGPLDSVEISVEDAVLTVEEEGRPDPTVTGTLDLTVTNRSETDIGYSRCGMALLRDLESRSLAVWNPLCSLEGSSYSIPIPAGQTLVTQVQVGATLDPSRDWKRPIAGTYRLMLYLKPEGEGSSPATSSSFQIEAD